MCATQPPINDLAALDAAVSGFNRIDLLSAVAGLQLLPENAERIVRLVALAYRVACGQSNRSRRIAPRSLRSLCNSFVLGTIAHAEDPFDSVFCEEMSFHGGAYRVLPGINEHATFILKRILESLFFHRDDFPDREYAVRFSREGFGLFLLNLGLPVDCLLTASAQDLQPDADLQIKWSVIPNAHRRNDDGCDRGLADGVVTSASQRTHRTGSGYTPSSSMPLLTGYGNLRWRSHRCCRTSVGTSRSCA